MRNTIDRSTDSDSGPFGNDRIEIDTDLGTDNSDNKDNVNRDKTRDSIESDTITIESLFWVPEQCVHMCNALIQVDIERALSRSIQNKFVRHAVRSRILYQNTAVFFWVLMTFSFLLPISLFVVPVWKTRTTLSWYDLVNALPYLLCSAIVIVPGLGAGLIIGVTLGICALFLRGVTFFAEQAIYWIGYGDGSPGSKDYSVDESVAKSGAGNLDNIPTNPSNNKNDGGNRLHLDHSNSVEQEVKTDHDGDMSAVSFILRQRSGRSSMASA